VKKTSRGFKIYSEFTDSYGSKIRIQESSNAEKTCVWIFCNNDTGHFSDPTPHLTVAQAKQVIKGLQAFIEDKK
jgi:hypothetical protein